MFLSPRGYYERSEFATINKFKVDFGEIDPNDRVNGLLGLDFLKGAAVIIDVYEDKIILI